MALLEIDDLSKSFLLHRVDRRIQGCQHVSFALEPGQFVGITGRSGSGKSTLLKLFMRFWETQQGEIALSHTNVNRINTQNLREMESFVTQETHLFHDSIRRNLCIAKIGCHPRGTGGRLPEGLCA